MAHDPKVPETSPQAYEKSLQESASQRLRLELYVAGTAPRSVRAILLLRSFCERYLSKRYDLEVIDIYQQPDLAERAGIFAVPALIKKEPLPEQIFIGDMSDLSRLLYGFGIAAQQPEDFP